MATSKRSVLPIRISREDQLIFTRLAGMFATTRSGLLRFVLHEVAARWDKLPAEFKPGYGASVQKNTRKDFLPKQQAQGER